ncbi:isochorismate synthase [Nocardioides humi]|uniref:isochorismate synthase n=1 Tax=Nocardioides humi TaxID=449461 RepID=A0ABN2A9X1_9ACTN|nr:isochorismate synthase [Nocardioides humi]
MNSPTDVLAAATDTRPAAGTTTAPDFTFAAGAYTLTCRGSRRTITTPAADRGALLAEVEAAMLTERESGHPHPLVVGAIPFDPRRPSRLLVPEHTTWEVAEGDPVAPDPGASAAELVDNTAAGYRAAVAEALARIEQGLVDKVVLARTVDALLPTGYDVGRVWARLRAANRDGFTYGVRLADGDHLVGASPELVAGTQGDRFRSHPLAGSAPRGATAAEDERITAALLASEKDRVEHAVLVDEVAANLAAVADEIRLPDGPRPFATARMWHLGTEIAARLHPGVGSLEAALALHPTAAVCGRPTEAAAALIGALEPEERGFYAGLIGWTDGHGNGTWALALRCAQIGGDRARMYAGAGIVAGSDPDAELAETTAKLRTMADALGLATGKRDQSDQSTEPVR